MSNEPEHQPDRVLWSGHPSHWHYVGSWLFGLLVVAALAVGIYFYRVELSQWMPWIYGLPVLVLLVVYVSVVFARGAHTYSVTNHRVISLVGRVTRDTSELRIQDIRSMNVIKSGFTGFLGVGRVEFSSAATDDADIIFDQIAGVDGVRDLVRKLQE